jgi:hypothetical protein
MRNITRATLLRGAVAIGLLATGWLVSLAQTPTAWAIQSGCRSDPTLLLSDGTIMDLSADISVSVAQVSQILYTVHAPPGTHVVLLIDTTGLLGYHESVQFYPDAPRGHYIANTFVTTTVGNANVTANALVGLRRGSASGLERQLLTIDLSR